MSARMISYDEIQIEILARHDLSEADRKEALEFIRDFRIELAKRVVDEFIPRHLHQKLNVKIG